jgi:hypothetical protein
MASLLGAPHVLLVLLGKIVAQFIGHVVAGIPQWPEPSVLMGKGLTVVDHFAIRCAWGPNQHSRRLIAQRLDRPKKRRIFVEAVVLAKHLDDLPNVRMTLWFVANDNGQITDTATQTCE